MLLPVLFYVWILGLGLGAHCKPAHRILSLLTFVLALGLALTLGPSTTTALPTPLPRSVGLVADHHQLTARNETIAALENTSIVTALVSYQQTSEGAKRQDGENCIIRNGQRECLNPIGGNPCEQYPSRKCPPPKKGSNPGGGGPGHNATVRATAQHLNAAQKFTTATDVVSTRDLATDADGHFEIQQRAIHRKAATTNSFKLDKAANAEPSAARSDASLVKAALAPVGRKFLDDGGGCVRVGNVVKCGRKMGPITNPCELYPSRKCPPAKKKGGSPGGGPGHNATAAQVLVAAEKLVTAEEVAAAKGYATAQDLNAKRLGSAPADDMKGSEGAHLHHPAIKKASTPAGSDEPTAPELTLAEPLLKGRHDKASLFERAFAWLLQERVKPVETTAVVVKKRGSPIKTDGLLGGDEEHH